MAGSAGPSDADLGRLTITLGASWLGVWVHELFRVPNRAGLTPAARSDGWPYVASSTTDRPRRSQRAACLLSVAYVRRLVDRPYMPRSNPSLRCSVGPIPASFWWSGERGSNRDLNFGNSKTSVHNRQR